MLILVLLLSQCRKDEQFTDDPGAKLELSLDTVHFDTVFTTVGSVTKRFTVRNRNSNAVRIARIDLQGGQPSPFRINVDGAPGTSFQDVEILGGDSMYVFVEVTLDPNNANNPLVIEDHIVFVTNGNVQDVLLVAWGQDAHFFYPDQVIPGFPAFSIIAGGNNTCEDILWQNDKPYVIYGYAVVDSCSSLTIEPGVQVYFHGGSGLWVYRYGQIIAQGTVSDRIVFQGDRLEPLYDELPGQWDRIWINEGDEDNVFEHVQIKNALIGIQSENFPLYPNEPTSTSTLHLDNVSIRNCSAAGILSRNFRISSTNLLVANCGQYAVALTGGGEYFFDHTSIGNFWSFELRQTPSFFLSNLYQDAFGNVQVRDIEPSEFRNGIIYGSLSEELGLEFDQSGNVDYNFHEYNIRTDMSLGAPEFGPNVTTDVDPGWVEPATHDLHLKEGSLMRNKAFTAPALDLDGQAYGCDGNLFDLGCYEWCP